jgi:phosphate starvation-inducible membrane PsiE
MFPEAFMVPIALLLLAVGFAVARDEVSYWFWKRQAGFRGASQGFGLFVDATYFIASAFGSAFLAAFVWEFGWKPTATLVLVGVIVLTVWRMIQTKHRNSPSVFIWSVAVFAVWPLMLFLARSVTWFGLVT